MQTTLKTELIFDGVGLHTGRPARLRLRPAPAGHGVVFQRTDVAGSGVKLPAIWNHVEISPLNTRLRVGDTIVSTIEHLMAALSGCGVHNVLIEIDGPEVPIMDGSSAEFVRGILGVGVSRQGNPLRAIKLLDEVRVTQGDAWASLRPATSLQIDFEIDFPDAAIGHQAKTLNMANGSFVHTLCDSRTFCRNSDVEDMRKRGLALGGTLENAVVVDGADVLTPGGLRHPDEAVRHKMLDALGDLYTAGAPILGRYTGHKAGHNLTNALLRALFDNTAAWRWMDCTPQIAARLPGHGVSAADMVAVA
ncbi:UDP-3-O-(3-hydroxymyristoyl) glucosamine N-acyltransferase [Loktanella sp. 3ANDIMAR09]|uniref:UDP-3-O-acyl-N-acetylglucosamine deacetylase n=1 Tax=Loktanella sp. 3ANDIMAR09 TaxID=1225657 RepID=UPI0006F875D8|nr:UDP-3-O-acyl-N-acetylglucosamine deacetylase [Loktanella sp. 3ANDIMAR09]KQI69475.1 UDP-3-O-(3-hydroxymyristoyl) glucosamine N-acyltransferase [Loktanella sp. 3ANDIMAR09]